MLVWLAVTSLGFVALVGVVVVLGVSTTGRYEFERNRVRAEQRQPAAVAAGNAATAGWWLVADSGEQPAPQVVAGPFADRVEADWAALASGLPHRASYGLRRAGGVLVPRPSPQEVAWLGELGQHLDRLTDDWDPVVSDTDALTTLVVEVTAALVEAGLSLHDGSTGGVCLTPHPGHRGILVSWRPHDRMSVHQVRGAAADGAIQHAMNVAVADMLARLGFEVEPFVTPGCHLVSVSG